MSVTIFTPLTRLSMQKVFLTNLQKFGQFTILARLTANSSRSLKKLLNSLEAVLHKVYIFGWLPSVIHANVSTLAVLSCKRAWG